MEVLGLVNEVCATVQQLSTTYQSLKDRYDKACENPALVNELGDVFGHLCTDLNVLANNCSSGNVNLSEEYLGIFKANIDKLGIFAHTVQVELEAEKEKLGSIRYRLGRAKRTNQWLKDLRNRASDAEQSILMITSPFSIMTGIAARSSSSEEQERFGPSFEVPENSGHVVLRFASEADMEGEAVNSGYLTPESRLKREVLRSRRSKAVAAVGSTKAQSWSIGVTGMSGVGKSCALRGLVIDEEVRERFGDGIYLVVLGMDATEEGVVRQLSQIVFQSGGHQCSKEVKAGMDIDGAVKVTKKWFKGKQTLLLLDDVWDKSGTCRNIVSRLARVVDTEVESCVVFTTRDLGVAMKGTIVKFSVRNAEESRGILLEAIGIEDGEVEGFEGLVDGVLGVCGGLPMALAVAGHAIKMRYHVTSDVTWKEAWQENRDEMNKYHFIVYGRDAGYEYENLSSAYETSLSMVEKHKSRVLGFSCSMSVAEMYRSLGVVQRQGCLPVHVLCSLWKTADEGQAKMILQALVESSLAERKSVVVNGKAVAGVALHDLQLDFVREECRKHGEAEKWHRELVSTWLQEESLGRQESVARSGECIEDDAFADEYIRNNLCRHLLCGGLDGDLEVLLLNPKWTLKKLCAGELLSLEEDFKGLLHHVREEQEGTASDRRTKRGSKAWSLKMISEAARLSAPCVRGNVREACFQMRARLALVAKESKVLKMFVSDIEVQAERPWLKSVTPCLEEPGGALEAVVPCRGEVHDVRLADDGESLYASGIDPSGDGKAFVCSVVNGQVEKRQWLNNAKKKRTVRRDEDAVKGGSEAVSGDGVKGGNGDCDQDVVLRQLTMGTPCEKRSKITCVCRSPDGQFAWTGHDDGTIRVWDSRCGTLRGEMRRVHRGAVQCVAWSLDGSRVASAGWDRAIRIWDGKTSEAMRNMPEDNRGWVWCIAWSPDGSRVASGRGDGSVQIWNVETGEAVGEAPERRWGSVCCVAWSADGRRVASGGRNGKLRIWDTETGEAVGDELEGHGDSVLCVAWSPDGRRVASGGGNGTLRIWDTVTGEAVGDELKGNGDCVLCVTWLPDGSRVACGADDRAVRIWDAETCKAVGDELEQHDTWVWFVAWSRDGSHVTSKGWDGSVKIWDVASIDREGQEGNGARCWEMTLEGRIIKCISHGEAKVLATLREIPMCSEISEDGRKIALGWRNGRVDILELME